MNAIHLLNKIRLPLDLLNNPSRSLLSLPLVLNSQTLVDIQVRFIFLVGSIPTIPLFLYTETQ